VDICSLVKIGMEIKGLLDMYGLSTLGNLPDVGEGMYSAF